MRGHIPEENIAALAGGEPRADEAAVKQHLSECPECRDRVELYRQDQHGLAGLRDAGIAPDDFAAVRLAVLGQIQGRRAARPGSFNLFHINVVRWATLAAAVLMAVTLATWWSAKAPAPEAPKRMVQPVIAPTEPPPVLAESPAPAPARPPVKRSDKPRLKAARVAPVSELVAEAPVLLSPVADDIILKLETDDPNVVIIWLASSKGAGR